MTRHRMSAVDTAWLHMDRPVNRMIVTTVMWFDQAPDDDAVRAVLAQRLVARYPRFRQRVVELPGLAWWEDVDVELADHVTSTRLPAPGGKAELEAFVGDLVHRKLALGRPLWEIHLVHGYRGEGGAIVARIHHCIADGIALAQVLLALTDAVGGPGADLPLPEQGDRQGRPVTRVAGVGARVAHTLVHPSRIVEPIHGVVTYARAAAALLSEGFDDDSALHGKVGLSKHVRWSEPIPMGGARAAAHRRGCTINDLALDAVTGALRSHLAATDGIAGDVRAIMPVNVRTPGDRAAGELGNRFGLVYVDLPASCDDRDTRLARIHASTAAIKDSAQAVTSVALLALMGVTPYGVEQSAIALFANRATLIVTNVPGPVQPVALAGCQLAGTVGWPPESGNLGLGISITSYCGSLILGICADDHLIGATDTLLADMVAEFEELVTSNEAQAPVAGAGVRIP